MKKITILLIIVLVVGFFAFRADKGVEDEEVFEEVEIREIEDIVRGFLGKPYELGPLGEKESEKIYRTDVFDCTTLVLVSVSKLHSDKPEEMIKKVNYFPPGEVSYENRLHFSSYRNKVSDYFTDITRQVGGDSTESKEVLLNKDRLIDIDWQEEIVLDYIPVSEVGGVLDNLPSTVGVMFMRDSFSDIGLDVGHEGFLFDGTNLIHASINRQKVVEDDFLTYLRESNHDGVIFYKIN